MTFPTWSVGEVLTAADMNTVGAICSTSVTGFKNAIINGDFSINQRNFSTGTSNDYIADRWYVEGSGGTRTATLSAFTPGNTITGQEPINFAQIQTAGQTGSAEYTLIFQKIEDVRSFAGQTVTVSFWARSTSGTPKIALEFQQLFGSGGSPSSAVVSYGGQTTITTTWTRYSITYAIPSISGKTIGTTANSSSLQVLLWLSAGSAFNSRTGSIGLQNNTIQIWGVQVEAGSVMTVFERRPRQVELALCQRYYFTFPTLGSQVSDILLQFTADQTTWGRGVIAHPVIMRASPTLAITPTAANWRILGRGGSGPETIGSITIDTSNPSMTLLNTNKTGMSANQIFTLRPAGTPMDVLHFGAEL